MTVESGILVAVGAGVLWGLCAIALDLYGRRMRIHGRFDAIVVLGCRVLPGGVPSGHLRRRVELAVRLWHEGAAPLVVLTGGIGRFPPSEAEVASRVAVSLGVPAEALRCEDRSTSTDENARFAARTTEARRVVVVTDSYHALRARRVFARHFEDVEVAAAVPPWQWRFRNALREVPAVALYFASGLLRGPARPASLGSST